MTNEVDMDADNIPPGRVTDLRANNLPDMVAVQFTAPGDDLDSNDKAASYVVKYSSTVGNLTGVNFDKDEFNTAITNDDLIDSTLEPQNGGTVKVFFIQASVFSFGRKYMLALRAVDEEGNHGRVSNMVQIYLPAASPSTASTTTTTTSPSTTTTSPSSPGCSDNLLFATSSYPDGKLTCYDDEGSELEKKGKKDEEEEELLSPGTTCVFFSSGHIDVGGFLIEMFCQDSHWKVTLTQL